MLIRKKQSPLNADLLPRKRGKKAKAKGHATLPSATGEQEGTHGERTRPVLVPSVQVPGPELIMKAADGQGELAVRVKYETADPPREESLEERRDDSASTLLTSLA